MPVSENPPAIIKNKKRVLLDTTPGSNSREAMLDATGAIELQTENKGHIGSLRFEGKKLILKNEKTGKEHILEVRTDEKDDERTQIMWINKNSLPSDFFDAQAAGSIAEDVDVAVEFFEIMDGKARVVISVDKPTILLVEEEIDSRESLTKKYNMVAEGKEGEVISSDKNCYAKTGKGGRESNQDGVSAEENLMVLADGVGGRAFGGIAATQAIKAANDIFTTKPETKVSKKVLETVCNRLKKEGLPEKSSTTLVLVKKEKTKKGKNKFEIGHAGDSKIYAISLSKQKIIALSKDQSAIQEAIDRGSAESLERYTNTQMSEITNSVRAEGMMQDPEILSCSGVPGDIAVIAVSDGISDFVTPEEVLQIVLDYKKIASISRETRQKIGELSGNKVKFEPKDLPELAQKIEALALSRQNKPHFMIRLQGKEEIVALNHGDNASVGIMM